jgi:colanic acid/amylovoran biosynthesis glycosyltransferase
LSSLTESKVSKLRIAVVAGVFPGWSTTFVLDQIGAALAAGHHVDVFAMAPGATAVNHPDVARFGIKQRTRYLGFQHSAKSKGSRLLLLASRLLAHPRATTKLLAKTKSLRGLLDAAVFMSGADYDVVHCHFATNALRILPAWQSGILRGSLLVTFHGFDIMRRPLADYAPLWSSSASFSANTEFLKGRAIALGAPAERVKVFPMGVDPSLYQPKNRDPELTGPFAIVSVARLVEFKGIEFGLRAVANLISLGLEVRYEICGTGRLLEPLRALAEELGIAKQVSFLGAQNREQVIAAMQRADVFLLPGIEDSEGQCEAQGVVLLEAAACGLPVVASRIGGVPEVVDDEVSGFLTQPRNVPDLVARLQKLALEPALRRKMGQAGREHVLQHFDQRLLNQRLLATYTQLVSSSKA